MKNTAKYRLLHSPVSSGAAETFGLLKNMVVILLPLTPWPPDPVTSWPCDLLTPWPLDPVTWQSDTPLWSVSDPFEDNHLEHDLFIHSSKQTRSPHLHPSLRRRQECLDGSIQISTARIPARLPLPCCLFPSADRLCQSWTALQLSR